MSKSKSKKTNKKTIQGTLIGIDYGENKTGIALGKSGLVAPLKVIKSRSAEEVVHEIIRMGMENKAEAYVLGIPLTSDGKETRQSLKVRNFGKILKILSKKHVYAQNEYNSTNETHTELTDLGIQPKRGANDDHLAAALILKNFFQEQKDL